MVDWLGDGSVSGAFGNGCQCPCRKEQGAGFLEIEESDRLKALINIVNLLEKFRVVTKIHYICAILRLQTMKYSKS